MDLTWVGLTWLGSFGSPERDLTPQAALAGPPPTARRACYAARPPPASVRQALPRLHPRCYPQGVFYLRRHLRPAAAGRPTSLHASPTAQRSRRRARRGVAIAMAWRPSSVGQPAPSMEVPMTKVPTARVPPAQPPTPPTLLVSLSTSAIASAAGSSRVRARVPRATSPPPRRRLPRSFRPTPPRPQAPPYRPVRRHPLRHHAPRSSLVAPVLARIAMRAAPIGNGAMTPSAPPPSGVAPCPFASAPPTGPFCCSPAAQPVTAASHSSLPAHRPSPAHRLLHLLLGLYPTLRLRRPRRRLRPRRHQSRCFPRRRRRSRRRLRPGSAPPMPPSRSHRRPTSPRSLW